MQKLYEICSSFFLCKQRFQLFQILFRYPGFTSVKIMVGQLPEFLRVCEPDAEIFKFCMPQRSDFLINVQHFHAQLLIPSLFFHDLPKKIVKICNLRIKTASGKVHRCRSLTVKQDIVLAVVSVADSPFADALAVKR